MASFIVFFVSIFIITSTAAIGALPALLWGLSWVNYLATFFILIAVQLFIGKLWNYMIDKSIKLRMKNVQATNAMAEAAQLVNVTCAYCGTSNLVKIYVGENNTFDCEACKETNSILIETSTARTTTPIMPKEEAATIFKNLDK